MNQDYILGLIDFIGAILIIMAAFKIQILFIMAFPFMALLAIEGTYYAINESKFRTIIYFSATIVFALSYIQFIVPSVAIFFAVLLFIKSMHVFVIETFR